MQKILLAEDDPMLARMYVKALQRGGYVVEVAGNGQEALEVLDRMQTLPDLVILDLLMPVLSGMEVLRGLKEDARFKRIPVIILTSLSGVKSEGEQALKMGASLYLVKGADSLQELLDKIQKLLQLPQEVNLFRPKVQGSV